tara:strand:- start:13320 stop:14198 length:879 start_codon:yes stop_codon:yes gene_type:complete
LPEFQQGSKIPNSHTAPVLPELAAKDATGEIAQIYALIEAALGVRLVNLVYRHLATVPGALEWAWYTVGEPFRAGVFAERSKSLRPAVDGLPGRTVSMAEAGLSAADAGQVIVTLDAYNRANPMNALSLRVIALALDAGRPAAAQRFVAPPPVELPDLLPMASLESVEPATKALLHRLARLTSGRDTRVVPSLFRHFAPWPLLLEQLADWLEEVAGGGSIEAQAARVFDSADAIARDIFASLPAPGANAVLPDPVTRRALFDTIEVFPPTICRMIVIAGLLRTALTPDNPSD